MLLIILLMNLHNAVLVGEKYVMEVEITNNEACELSNVVLTANLGASYGL